MTVHQQVRRFTVTVLASVVVVGVVSGLALAFLVF